MNTAIFEIFRAGKHQRSKNGGAVQWTDNDLQQIKGFYSEAIRTAPLVIGHPEDDKPEFGSVKRLIYHNGALFAEAEISPELIYKIKSGGVSGISASIYKPDDNNNPVKQLGYYLKHVGFLESGKDEPAVKGMLDPKSSVEYLSYSEIKSEAILFCEKVSSGTYAERTHEKACYFQTILGVDYKTALNISEQ